MICQRAASTGDVLIALCSSGALYMFLDKRAQPLFITEYTKSTGSHTWVQEEE